ncbi:hypothetical protein BBW69_00440 [Neisseria sp. RH3002v2f]|nr:YadA C-terminal domain-containing protein [Neisseria sp. RH3002v2f]MBD0763756.1 hypothetical protein [Neisseria sp. RH3002v2f]
MKHFQSKVLTAAILAALSGSAIAADVYLKNEVYSKEEVNTEITNAKTAVEEKINAAKKELGDKLDKQKDSDSKEIEKVKTAITGVKNLLVGDPKDDQNPGLIGTIDDLNKSINGDVEENGKKIPGLIDTVAELDKSVKSNKSEIDELKKDLETTDNALDETTNALNKAEEKVTAFADETKKNIEATNEKLNDVAASVDSHEETLKEIATSLDETNTKADEAVKTANEAKKVADEAKQTADDTKQNVDAKIKAATDAAGEAKTAAGEAKTAAGEAKKAAEKVTDIEEAAEVALIAAHKNTQDIHGFEEGDIIYKKDKNGKITEKEATAADVEADEFKGMGLKGIVAEHDESLDKLTETVNENSEALVKTAGVINEISTDVKANKAAIDKKADQTALDEVSGKVATNKAAIDKKADQTALDEVSGKVATNKAAIDKKANSADVYTKEQSNERFVKIDTSINGLNTTANGLETRLTAAEKSVKDHGTRLDSAEKSITEHGTRLNGLDKAVSDLRKETRQGLAEQAALSGLFQPYNVGRFNVTAAVGGYKSESAVAIGTGFRFTENFAAKAGVAVGTSSGSSAAYHVGVNYEW